MKHGSQGGYHAAYQLQNSAYQTIPPHTPLWKYPQTMYVKYFLDIPATARDMVKNGVVNNVADFVGFLDGFSSYPTIDCVQTGSEHTLSESILGKFLSLFGRHKQLLIVV